MYIINHNNYYSSTAYSYLLCDGIKHGRYDHALYYQTCLTVLLVIFGSIYDSLLTNRFGSVCCYPHFCTLLHPPATLPTPQVSTVGPVNDQQLQVNLTRPQNYSSGRFILRYDCRFRGPGFPINLEYRSVEINSGSSDVIVRRSTRCFVEGEISRVTVWFVSGGHISCAPAVVNATSGEGERRKC